MKVCEMSVFFLILFIALAVLVYIRAVNSRKFYKCPECGESFRVELMKASRCKVCGAVINNTDNPNISDKA